MQTRSRNLTFHVAASVVLLTGLAGCGDDEPVVDPAPSTSSPSETGSAIRESIATVRMPEKWVSKGDQLFTDAERAPKNEARLEKEVFGFIDFDVEETDDALSLDEAAREAATAYLVEGKRVEDSELGGEPAFVFTKSLPDFGSTEYNIGLARGRDLVLLDFSLIGATSVSETP